MTLIGDFEGPHSRDLTKERYVLVLVRNQVAVQVVVQVRLWNLVSHGDCIRDMLHDGAGDWHRREIGESFAKKTGESVSKAARLALSYRC